MFQDTDKIPVIKVAILIHDRALEHDIDLYIKHTSEQVGI